MAAQRTGKWWLSGLYGLHAATSQAYEIVWMRLMAVTLGTSLAAMGLVLAVFVAGLGLGAAGLAWSAQRRSSSTRWLFVFIQALLGLWGGMLPWLVGWTDHLYVAWAPAAESPAQHGFRFLVSVICLLPPSCLIGTVFPLLSDGVRTAERGTTSPGLARLYRAGLIASAVGAVVTPFWLIPVWGLSGTSLLLGALNGLGALTGLLTLNTPRPVSTAPHTGPAVQPSVALRPRYLLSASLGFCLFAVQLIGAQYLWLLVDATAYVEGMVLGAVLLGMAGGAMAAVSLQCRRIPLEWRLGAGFLIMAAWQLLWLALAADIALNQVGRLELRALVRTFSEVFPQTSLWLTGGYLLLYGGLDPLAIDWAAFQRRFQARPPSEDIDPADFLGMFIAAGAPVREWSVTAPLNTDDRPLIEYGTAWGFARLNTVALAVENLQALILLHQPVTQYMTSLTERERLEQIHAATHYLWQGIVTRAGGELTRAREYYEHAHALNPANYQVRSFLAQDLAARGRQALLAGHHVEATALLSRALRLNGRNPQARLDLALTYAMRGEDAAAVGHFRQLRAEDTTVPHLRFNLGVSLYRLGLYAEAAEQFAEVVANEPASAHFNLANSLAQAGRYEEAVQWYERTIALDPRHSLVQENLQAVQTWLAQRQAKPGD